MDPRIRIRSKNFMDPPHCVLWLLNDMLSFTYVNAQKIKRKKNLKKNNLFLLASWKVTDEKRRILIRIHTPMYRIRLKMSRIRNRVVDGKIQSLIRNTGCQRVLIYSTVLPRVADPHLFHPDPDPAFSAEYRSGSRALKTKNWKKYSWKFFFFWSKTTIYLSLGLHKEHPSYKRRIQLSTEAIQHFKTWTSTF